VQNCKSLLVTLTEERFQETSAILRILSGELSSRLYFPAGQDAERNSRHSERNMRKTSTIVCHCRNFGGLV
jgi:hypothetical protein